MILITKITKIVNGKRALFSSFILLILSFRIFRFKKIQLVIKIVLKILIRIFVYIKVLSLNGKLLANLAVSKFSKELIWAIGAARKNKKVKTIKEDKNGEF